MYPDSNAIARITIEVKEKSDDDPSKRKSLSNMVDDPNSGIDREFIGQCEFGLGPSDNAIHTTQD